MSRTAGKQHSIVVKKPDGGAEIYPMKQWLRAHPQHLPEGMDASENTSHELRRALKSHGWKLDEREDQVFLIKPDEDGDTFFAEELIGPVSNADTSYEITEAEEVTFGLERDLQLSLRSNIQQLESDLRIIDEGKERHTDAGRIDITAVDGKGNIVVIELKAGMASPDVIAQVLAYMAVVGEAEKKPVRGILIAGDFHKRVMLAARAIPNLTLKKYSFKFTFETVN